jgi:hypothetical protein
VLTSNPWVIGSPLFENGCVILRQIYYIIYMTSIRCHEVFPVESLLAAPKGERPHATR